MAIEVKNLPHKIALCMSGSIATIDLSKQYLKAKPFCWSPQQRAVATARYIKGIKRRRASPISSFPPSSTSTNTTRPSPSQTDASLLLSLVPHSNTAGLSSHTSNKAQSTNTLNTTTCHQDESQSGSSSLECFCAGAEHSNEPRYVDACQRHWFDCTSRRPFASWRWDY